MLCTIPDKKIEFHTSLDQFSFNFNVILLRCASCSIGSETYFRSIYQEYFSLSSQLLHVWLQNLIRIKNMLPLSNLVVMHFFYFRAGTFCTYAVGMQLSGAFDLVASMAVDNLDNADTFVKNTVDVCILWAARIGIYVFRSQHRSSWMLTWWRICSSIISNITTLSWFE